MIEISEQAGISKSRSANRRFTLHKRSQPFICADNETLSIAMRGNNPDGLPGAIPGLRPTQIPTAFLETVKCSIVSFDRPFDYLGFLSEKFRQMLFYVVRS